MSNSLVPSLAQYSAANAHCLLQKEQLVIRRLKALQGQGIGIITLLKWQWKLEDSKFSYYVHEIHLIQFNISILNTITTLSHTQRKQLQRTHILEAS